MKCKNCGRIIHEEEWYLFYNDDFYCEDCRDELFTECEDCGNLIPNDEVCHIGLGDYCEDCVNENFTICDECGDYVRNEDVRELHGQNYCRECFYELTVECCECGEVVLADDAIWDDGEENWVYKDCLQKGPIMQYHEFDSWHTYTHGEQDNTLKKGFELEVSTSNSKELAKRLKDEFGEFFVYEYDGSVYGFEIISNPFTQIYQKNEDFSKRLFEILNDDGFDNNGCGLHVHVNRADLATDKLSQEEVIDNIYLIMETFRDELTLFSRRSKADMREWSSFLLDEDEVTMEKIKDAKCAAGRYYALNNCNRETIEFRIFKGATTPLELMGSIEMVDSIVSLAKGDVDGITWEKIVSYGANVKLLNEKIGISSKKALKVIESIYFNNPDFFIGEEVEVNTEYGTTSKAIVVQKDIGGYLVYVLDNNFYGHCGNFNGYTLMQKGIGKCFWWFSKRNIKRCIHPFNYCRPVVGDKVEVEYGGLRGITEIRRINRSFFTSHPMYEFSDIDKKLPQSSIKGFIKIDDSFIRLLNTI